jgi:peptidoglycan hydrolase CwlO-like protein
MTEAEELRDQLKAVTAERNKYHAELTDLRLKKIEDRQTDHEDRIRSMETIGTRFNTIYAMFAGNSLMSIIALIKLFAQP